MRYLRRLIWFIASRLLVILLVLGLLTVAFYFSMNATNIYIIIKDGMARRAQVIMMDEPVSQLDNYFSSSWIARDDWLQSALNNVDPYRDCTVTGFDHRVSLQRVWCWPWMIPPAPSSPSASLPSTARPPRARCLIGLRASTTLS